MPVNGKDTTESCYILSQWQYGSASLLVGQVHVRRIKQRRIHDVQRQLQQAINVEMLENLSSPGTVADRFVVPGG